MILLFGFVWVRGTLPRVRYDQLMDLGWKVLIPLSIGWLLVLATFHVARDQGWNGIVVVAIAGTIGLIFFGLLRFAIATSKAKRLEGVID